VDTTGSGVDDLCKCRVNVDCVANVVDRELSVGGNDEFIDEVSCVWPNDLRPNNDTVGLAMIFTNPSVSPIALATPRTFSILACAAPNVASASASDIPKDATSGP
jgi:hypothetical protein